MQTIDFTLMGQAFSIRPDITSVERIGNTITLYYDDDKDSFDSWSSNTGGAKLNILEIIVRTASESYKTGRSVGQQKAADMLKELNDELEDLREYKYEMESCEV